MAGDLHVRLPATLLEHLNLKIFLKNRCNVMFTKLAWNATLGRVALRGK
jgi:hypothetical protein